MIEVTRLNEQKFMINAIYIEKVEALPDTTITLINGKKYFVRESVGDISNKIVNFYKQIGFNELAKKVVIQDE